MSTPPLSRNNSSSNLDLNNQTDQKKLQEAQQNHQARNLKKVVGILGKPRKA